MSSWKLLVPGVEQEALWELGIRKRPGCFWDQFWKSPGGGAGAQGMELHLGVGGARPAGRSRVAART